MSEETIKKENFETLTPEQEAELKTSAALPDDQINTDDIPEQKDWSGAKRGLFFRPKVRN